MPRRFLVSFLVLSLTAYILSGYFLERTNFPLLITLYSALFGMYFLALKYETKHNLQYLLAAGISFRLVLVFAIPVHSDDVYRFIWDGYIQTIGVNPYDYTPRELLSINNEPFLDLLYAKINSPDYHSVYPQLCQSLFRISATVAGESILGNVILLKTVIFLAECGSLYMLYLLLPPGLKSRILIYALNPLIIMELVGNIHLEALMICFALLSVVLFRRKWILSSAGAFALAIHAKLFPLVLLPLIWKWTRPEKALIYSLSTLFITIALLLVTVNDSIRLSNLLESLNLYYGKFEFNGGIYLTMRSIGWEIMGYNPIQTLSKLLIVSTLIGWIFIYTRRWSLPKTIFWMISLYLFLSIVVHPWYLAPLVALSVFVNYRFAIVWSALIPFTYFSYGTIPYEENYWIVGAEYLILFVMMWLELRNINAERLPAGSANIHISKS